MNSSFTHFWANAFLRVLGTCLLIFGVQAGTSRAQQATPAGGAAPAGDVEKGKQAYRNFKCYACHGYSGHGGFSPAQRVGPRIATPARTIQAFASYVRKPGGSMPPYGNQITDAQLADIYAFLKSVPPSPDPKSIPLLNDD